MIVLNVFETYFTQIVFETNGCLKRIFFRAYKQSRPFNDKRRAHIALRHFFFIIVYSPFFCNLCHQQLLHYLSLSKGHLHDSVQNNTTYSITILLWVIKSDKTHKATSLRLKSVCGCQLLSKPLLRPG